MVIYIQSTLNELHLYTLWICPQGFQTVWDGRSRKETNCVVTNQLNAHGGGKRENGDLRSGCTRDLKRLQ